METSTSAEKKTCRPIIHVLSLSVIFNEAMNISILVDLKKKQLEVLKEMANLDHTDRTMKTHVFCVLKFGFEIDNICNN